MGPNDEIGIFSDLLSIPVYRWIMDVNLLHTGSFDCYPLVSVSNSIKEALINIKAQNDKDKEFLSALIELQSSVEALNTSLDPNFVKAAITAATSELEKASSYVKQLSENYKLVNKDGDRNVIAGISMTLKNIKVRLLSIIDTKSENKE